VSENQFSHISEDGEARMVDVGQKPVTSRLARARALVRMNESTRDAIISGQTKKGAVLATARIAGIQAAKKTGELIPLCHPLGLDHVDIEFAWREDDGDEAILEITTSASLSGKTGVEMEALTAASVAALTVYDMCKAADRGMSIERVELIEKRGGKSGTWARADD